MLLPFERGCNLSARLRRPFETTGICVSTGPFGDRCAPFGRKHGPFRICISHHSRGYIGAALWRIFYARIPLPSVGDVGQSRPRLAQLCYVLLFQFLPPNPAFYLFQYHHLRAESISSKFSKPVAFICMATLGFLLVRRQP